MQEGPVKRSQRGHPRRGEPPKPQELVGRKHLLTLLRHRRRLRQAYAHGNRTLHYDTVLTAYLLSFFNPTLRSLRTLEDFSKVSGAQEYLDVERLARSTLSDANQLFDPKLLEPLVEELQSRIPDLDRIDSRLSGVLKQLRLVDGSYFSVAADVQWALRKRKCGMEPGGDDCFVRLDLQLCCATGTPQCVEINGQGTSEVAAARRHIQAGVIYVADRGIFSFGYVGDLLNAGADFVLRIKTSQLFQPLKELPLSDQDRAAGVISDRLGVLTGAPYRPAPPEQLREVRIADPNNPGKVIRLLTSLTDPSQIAAGLAGEIYRRRWQIELFFRWLKVHAHFRRLISQNAKGIGIGFYVAVIGVLLIYLHSGRRPSKYAFSMLSLAASGQATLKEILPILEARERAAEKERQRLARKKAQKTGL